MIHPIGDKEYPSFNQQGEGAVGEYPYFSTLFNLTRAWSAPLSPNVTVPLFNPIWEIEGYPCFIQRWEYSCLLPSMCSNSEFRECCCCNNFNVTFMLNFFTFALCHCQIAPSNGADQETQRKTMT